TPGRLPAQGPRGAGSGVPGERRAKSGPVRCRVCGRGLKEAAERKLGRCVECPSDLDEELLGRLRDWRLGRAAELGQPAFCVFTDATLTAIAEARPGSAQQLARVSGVSRTKLTRFGAEVLALVAGRSPDDLGEVPDDAQDPAVDAAADPADGPAGERLDTVRAEPGESRSEPFVEAP
ncbi:MAG: HRDC domain-containing protein, partial [Streptomycetaceae bacterium]|nr:HRDC domain-containing protein [Streptomycetaceae bacterium]